MKLDEKVELITALLDSLSQHIAREPIPLLSETALLDRLADILSAHATVLKPNGRHKTIGFVRTRSNG